MRILILSLLLHLICETSVAQLKFETAFAENIDIVSREKFDFCEAPFCRPVFSPDNKTIAYLQSENTHYVDYIDKKNKHTIVIKNLQLSSVIAKIPIGSTTKSGALAWSPDQKTLYYINNKNSFVYNSDTKKIIKFAIDFSGNDNEGLDKCFLYKENLICYFPYAGTTSYNRLAILINLDNLQLEYYQYNNPSNTEFISSLEELYRQRVENSSNLNFTLSAKPKGKYLFRNEPLILRNKKGHYGKQLLDNISPEKLSISSNLKYFITWGYDRYTLYTLGAKASTTEVNFSIPLNKEELLTQELRLNFDNLFNKGVPIWGYVYKTKVNPLNNKIIGADKNMYKGMVLFTMSGDNISSVTKYLEIQPITEGDIVTDIFSNDDPHTGENIKDLGIWTTLGKFNSDNQKLAPFEIFSDEKESYDSKTEKKLYDKVDNEASFPGGEIAWRNFLNENLNQKIPIENKAPNGIYTVIVQFLVDEEGNISDIKTLTQNGYGMEYEIIRVIEKIEKFVPAINKGINVKSYRKLPITFSVNQSLGESSNNKNIIIQTALEDIFKTKQFQIINGKKINSNTGWLDYKYLFKRKTLFCDIKPFLDLSTIDTNEVANTVKWDDCDVKRLNVPTSIESTVGLYKGVLYGRFENSNLIFIIYKPDSQKVTFSIFDSANSNLMASRTYKHSNE